MVVVAAKFSRFQVVTVRVPNQDSPVIPSAGRYPPVWQCRHGADPAIVAADHDRSGVRLGWVPDQHSSVAAVAGNSPVLQHSKDVNSVAAGQAEACPAAWVVGVPQQHASVVPAGDYPPVREHRYRHHVVAVNVSKFHNRLDTAGGIPEVAGRIPDLDLIPGAGDGYSLIWEQG
jgi:hypothetical protein